MQNNESVQKQSRPPTAVKSSVWQHAAIALVITALIAGAGVYLLRLRIAHNPSQGNEEIFFQLSPIPTREPLPTGPPLPTLFVSNTFYPVPTTNPSVTANWKTYTNEKYGVTFRYPPHMYTNSLPCPTGYRCYLEQIAFNTQQIPPGLSYNEFLTYAGYNYHDNSMLFYVDSESRGIERYLVGPKLESIVIGGKNGEIYSKDYVFEHSGEKLYDRMIKISYKVNNNQTFYITIDYSDFGDNPINIDEFDQILSTFKFTD